MNYTNDTADLLLSLLRTTIDNAPVSVSASAETLWNVFEIAKFHSVEATAYYGIIKNNIELPGELREKWQNRQLLNTAKTMVESYERDSIYDLFSKNGIAFLPLKGLVMKQMYPAPEYRQMADLDILIHKEQMEEASNLLIERGYERTHADEGNHDVFFKPPYITIELHHEMVAKNEALFHEYYKTIWTKATKENGFQYQLNWNDFYIFQLVHFAKHYYHYGGSGVRSIMDIYVFLKNHKGDLDEAYLSKELEKLRLVEFRSEAEKLALMWFGRETIDDSEMGEYVLTSGVQGTKKHILERRIEQNSENGKLNRWSYIQNRLFPDRHFMAYYYPEVEKKPYLLPWFWMKRFAKKWRRGLKEYKDVTEKQK